MIPFRLAALPTPLPDESLTSWMIRLSIAYHLNLREMVSLILKVDPRVLPPLEDLDRYPPPSLIEALCVATRWPEARFSAMLIRPARVAPRQGERTVIKFCARCWHADVGRTGPYLRRAWSHHEYRMCERHLAPLTTQAVRLPVFRFEPAYGGAISHSSADSCPLSSRRAMVRLQRLLCAEACGCLRPQERQQALALRVLVGVVAELHALDGLRGPGDSSSDRVVADTPPWEHLRAASVLWELIRGNSPHLRAQDKVMLARLRRSVEIPSLQLACEEVRLLLRGAERDRWGVLVKPSLTSGARRAGLKTLSAAEQPASSSFP
jgi:hypothetical protein